MRAKEFKDLTWWLNLTQSDKLKDSEFKVLKNFFYNNSKQLQTRLGYTTFGNAIGSSPITSYFFFQHDETKARMAVCNSGTTFYKYNESTENRDSVQSNLIEYETLPQKTANRTRWDYAVYKNVIYTGDWVNPYASYDWTTYTQIGLTNVSSWISFDHTSNLVQKTWHSLSDWSEIFFYQGTMPSEITLYQVYYVVNSNANDFQISTTKWWDVVSFTDNWSWTPWYKSLSEPRCRYLQYLWDRVYWAWDDSSPNTLYYTNAAPADGTNINQNALVVWWDEQGNITWLREYSQLVLTFKSWKIYAINVATPSADPVDSQTWWYWDRCIHSVWNWLVYFNERWIDTLKNRDWVSGAAGIESEPLSDNVRALIETIKEKQFDSWAAYYNKILNNYYFSFDTSNDNRPNTHLVYNSLVWAWSEYVLPPIYDYGHYVDSDWVVRHLFASASGWQMYEFEKWYDDNGTAIEYELESKDYDFWTEWLKIFEFMTFSGYKQENWDVDITVMVDGEEIWVWVITDSNLDLGKPRWSLGVDSMGVEVLWGVWSDNLPMYPFRIRIPFYARWENISYRLKCTWVQLILETVWVKRDNEEETIFYIDDTL